MKKKLLLICLSIILIFLLIVFFVQKNTITTLYLLKSGSVIQENFVEEVAYVEKNGIMIIPVQIDGEKFNFIFDTGAINVISPRLAKKFDLKGLSTTSANDSQGNSIKQKITKIPKLEIGHIEFKNTAAAIINLQEQLYCFEVDGIIGSNLMQNAIWKIDKEHQTISFTDEIENFSLENYKQIISFSDNLQKTPMISVMIGNKKEKAKFDTGFNQKIQISGNLQDYISVNTNSQIINVFGNASFGIFEKKIDSSSNKQIVKISSVKLDQMGVKDKIVSFSKNQESLIGQDFFDSKSYILDWKQKKIFINNDKSNNGIDGLKGFGFAWNLNGEKIYISELYKPSKAFEKLKLGDIVTVVNGDNWEKMNKTEWCQILEQKLPDSLSLIINRKGKTKNISLVRETFIK